MARGVGGRGPANIMRHLKGIKFPADKETILDHVEKVRDEPMMPDTDEVLEVLRQIPTQEYESPAQIMKAVGKIE